MLSDDVTKVMEEQHMLEGTYADLIAKRSELKGISKKPELMATKKQINVSKQSGYGLKFKLFCYMNSKTRRF